MTETELQELGLPDIFKAIGDGTAPEELQSVMLPTGEFLRKQSQLAQSFAPAAGYVPLWMLAASGVVAFDRQRGEYVRYYVGDKSDTVVARDYEELCAFLFLELMEIGLWDELAELAPLFRFEHLGALKSYVEHNEPKPSHEMAQEFIKTIR